ncbi:DUF374 domain-containing protein [bacterium]|nr:DUF374 domain-containing protein [bacterium]
MNVLADAMVLLTHLYVSMLKIRIYYHPGITDDDMRKALFAFWHGRQFLLVPFFSRLNIAILADLSWAGEIQARVLKRLGYNLVRGSTKRKPVRVLLQMKAVAEAGSSLAFAVDGPRGPIHVSKPGIVFLARKLDHPIIPLATSADRAWYMKSTWDRYMVPAPFSRCLIAFGKPVYVSEEYAGTDLDTRLLQWQNHCDEICRQKQ